MGYFLSAVPKPRKLRPIALSIREGPGSSEARGGASPVRPLPFGCSITDRVDGDRRPTQLDPRKHYGPRQYFAQAVLTAVARAVVLPYILHVTTMITLPTSARGGMMRRLVRGMFAAAEQTFVLGAEAERTLRAALALPDARTMRYRPSSPRQRWTPRLEREHADAFAAAGRVLKQKWKLDALLGIGGMAAVYAATHRNGGRAAM